MIATKILIAEDDVLISEELKDILINVGYDVVGIAEDYDAAVKIIEATPPDIALLDINMHGREQGYEIATYLNDIPYLFISSYTDSKTLDKAGSLSPASYITKPFSKEQVLTAIKIAITTSAPPENYILVKDGIKEVKIILNDILWMQAEGVYIKLYTKTKKIALRTSLSSFLEEYKNTSIIRIHRSYAVNMNNVSTISNSFVHFTNQKLPLARSYKEEILEFFSKQK